MKKYRVDFKKLIQEIETFLSKQHISPNLFDILSTQDYLELETKDKTPFVIARNKKKNYEIVNEKFIPNFKEVFFKEDSYNGVYFDHDDFIRYENGQFCSVSIEDLEEDFVDYLNTNNSHYPFVICKEELKTKLNLLQYISHLEGLLPENYEKNHEKYYCGFMNHLDTLIRKNNLIITMKPSSDSILQIANVDDKESLDVIINQNDVKNRLSSMIYNGSHFASDTEYFLVRLNDSLSTDDTLNYLQDWLTLYTENNYNYVIEEILQILYYTILLDKFCPRNIPISLDETN